MTTTDETLEIGTSEAAPTVTLTFAQLKELLSQTGTAGFSADSIAQAFAATQKKENIAAPMFSVYNPRGDRDHPKAGFVPKKILQNGIELEPETLTVEEVDALNCLRPGTYRVTKANETTMPFTVNDTKAFDGVTVERRELNFPSKDEHRYDHRSLLEYCLEVLTQSGQTKDVERIRALRVELNALRKAG